MAYARVCVCICVFVCIFTGTLAATLDRHSLFVWRVGPEITHPLNLPHTKPYTVRSLHKHTHQAVIPAHAQLRSLTAMCVYGYVCVCVGRCVCDDCSV